MLHEALFLCVTVQLFTSHLTRHISHAQGKIARATTVGQTTTQPAYFPPLLAGVRVSCIVMPTTMGQVDSGWNVITTTSARVRKVTRIKPQWTNPTVIFCKTLNTVITSSFDAGRS